MSAIPTGALLGLLNPLGHSPDTSLEPGAPSVPRPHVEHEEM